MTQVDPETLGQKSPTRAEPGLGFCFRSYLRVNRETICDELRRLEGEVVEAEHELAKQEALLIRLKQEHQDVSRVTNALSLMREQQQSRQQDRLRLLALLQQ